MRIIIFGTGKMYERYKHELSNIPIVALLDNDPNKQGMFLDGVLIEAPSKINQYSYDYVFILSIHHKEMREQLLREGVLESCIVDIEHKGFFEDLFEMKYYLKTRKDSNKKNILFCSHDLCLTGAPLVLYYAAILIKDYYNISVLSKADGPLKYDFLESGISVIICKDISVNNLEIYKIFNEFDLLFVNTLIFSSNINNIAGLNKPVLWWLHEERDVYDSLGISGMRFILKENIYPYSVSKCVDNAFYKCYNVKINRMRYGIPYHNSELKNVTKSKLIFAIIGSVGKRKAQDVFVEATKRVCEVNNNVEFWIIGQIDECDKLKYEKERCIKVFGGLSHEQVIELYSDIDVIVCPSLNDPLPVVLSEGMMLKKVCIMSNVTGTAEVVEPYKSGLICRPGDVGDLAEKMSWVINNQERLSSIGEEAYRIYEKYFSLNQFKDNLLNNINNLLDEAENGY